jgi:hypothetical protein
MLGKLQAPKKADEMKLHQYKKKKTPPHLKLHMH